MNYSVKIKGIKEMNILILNTSRMVGDSGGLAKVTCSFANEMTRRGHKVSLVYADDKKGDFFYPIDHSVDCYDVRLQNGVRINLPVLMRLKREFFRIFSEQKCGTVDTDFFGQYISGYIGTVVNNINPDVIVSFTPKGSKTLIVDLELEKKFPIISMSHGDPADYFEFYPLDSQAAIKRSTVNQVLLPSFKKVLEDQIPNGKVVVIGNVVTQFENPAELKENKDIYKILFIGRLSKEHKRPHLLIESFSKVAKQYPNWIVEFWGADANKAYKLHLESKVKLADLSDRVFFKGVTKDVEKVLETGDIFAMMSAMEGFGLSMAEAMSKGLPVLACNSWQGITDLVEDNITGMLVDDNVDAIAKALKILMDDYELRKNIGIEARNSMKRFHPEIIWKQWEDLLEEVVKTYNNHQKVTE